jgi:hypothetical protein
MIKYAYSSFVDTYFSFLLWQNYKNNFINVQGSSLEHIRERPAGFLMSEVISQNREFHFS